MTTTRTTITLTNDFHDSSVTVRPVRLNRFGWWQLNARQVKRAWQELCGRPSCQCGDNGIRGTSNPEIEWAYDTDHGSVLNVYVREGWAR